MKVPYGRYEGQPLNVVPTRALKTIQHATCANCERKFLAALAAELERRERGEAAAAGKGPDVAWLYQTGREQVLGVVKLLQAEGLAERAKKLQGEMRGVTAHFERLAANRG